MSAVNRNFLQRNVAVIKTEILNCCLFLRRACHIKLDRCCQRRHGYYERRYTVEVSRRLRYIQPTGRELTTARPGMRSPHFLVGL